MQREHYYTLDDAKEAAIKATGIQEIVTEVGCHTGYTEEGLVAFHIWPTYDTKFRKAFYISFFGVQPSQKVSINNMVYTEGEGITKLHF